MLLSCCLDVSKNAAFEWFLSPVETLIFIIYGFDLSNNAYF